MATLWIVSLPNNKEKSSTSFRALSAQFQSQCDLHSFTIPNLVVGTLDTLIALSDDLSKTCTQIEVGDLLCIEIFVKIFALERGEKN
jgi:hypothetical protein